jgi:CheY-like chemotaxis protein
LLTFSRKTETKPLDLDLNQRIRQTQKFLERTIQKMIDIEMVLADDLADIHADPTQVDQVLMNLAVNARDAMPEGGKLVIETANVILHEDYTRLHVEAKPGSYVLLSVSDTGSGMDKETLEHIFEPFYTTKGSGEGTGLGLAMVFGIVKQHHGFIKCYSEVGHGTTFRIYLPAIISETHLDQPVVTAMPQGGTETILLVDDEELIRDLGKRILRKAGYTVLTAYNGKEALDLYRSNKGTISLVILDLIMPEMGGKQCLEELLRIDPQVKTLIASGFAANRQTTEALERGARGFVDKPYNMNQVLQVVRELLDEC